MKRKMSALTLVMLTLAAVFVLAGCSGSGVVVRGDRVSGTGTVTRVELEGGFFGIIGDDGQKYDPVNLAKEYQQDGLRVSFEATIRRDLASTHMWGTLVEITSITYCSS